MTDPERQDVFNRWVADFRPLLRRTVRAFAADADADDLMQELLLALWKAVPAFRAESRATTFVYRVVHNAALTWSRGRRRHAIQSLSTPESVLDDSPGASEREDQRLLDALYAHIRKLPPIDRSLMLLSLDDLTYQQIADVHGMSPGAVGTRLHRLRKTLMQDLKENLDDH